MAKKVLILRWGGSAYDSLGGLLELMAQQFAGLGMDVMMFPADGEGWGQRLVQVLGQGDVAFALTMSGIGVETVVNNRLIWDVAQVPLFNWCCDHPCYYPLRHVIRSRYLLHGYVFPDHARYNITHLKPNGVAYAAHLGIPPRSVFPRAPLPAQARNGRIMFTKSGSDTNAIEAKWRGFGTELAEILFTGAEALMHRPTADFVPVLRQIAEPRGLFFDGHSSVAMVLINELDSYIRFRRADMVMRALLPFPVDVFGVGWDYLPWDGAKARYHGPIAWRQMIDSLPNYTGCVSINPLIEESVHDRVFFALAAGVPPISDANAFSRANMLGLAPYSFAFQPGGIAQAVEAVLADPTAAIDCTEQAWAALSGPFGLRRAAAQIAQFASMQMLNTPAGG